MVGFLNEFFNDFVNKLFNDLFKNFFNLFCGFFYNFFGGFFLVEHGVGILMQILFAHNRGNLLLGNGRGSLGFEETNHTRGEQEPHQHNLRQQYGSTQTGNNKLGIGNGQEVYG